MLRIQSPGQLTRFSWAARFQIQHPYPPSIRHRHPPLAAYGSIAGRSIRKISMAGGAQPSGRAPGYTLCTQRTTWGESSLQWRIAMPARPLRGSWTIAKPLPEESASPAPSESTLPGGAEKAAQRESEVISQARSNGPSWTQAAELSMELWGTPPDPSANSLLARKP